MKNRLVCLYKLQDIHLACCSGLRGCNVGSLKSVLLFVFIVVSPGLFGQISKDSLNVIDSSHNNVLNEVVVSASRKSERIFNSAISIQLLNAMSVLNSTASSCFDAIGNLRGVQVLVPSLGFRVLNARGFSNTTNVRFVQLVDGIDNQAPHIGAPIGNALGASDLDIDKVEMIAGTAAALYGLNAINGLVNIRTKNPFEYQGLAFQSLTGINHVGGIDKFNPSFYQTTNLRYAKILHPKFAFKCNFSAVTGTDWVANDRTDLAANQNGSLNLNGGVNPALDEVNSYGNESSNRRAVTSGGKNYVVARTGYREEDLDDYKIENFKGDAGVFFRPKKRHELSLVYRGALVNTIYQRTNRFRLQDYRLNQFALDYSTSFLQFKAYLTQENSGNSYNIRSLGENLDRANKSDGQWYSDYTSQFNSVVANGGTISEALSQARVVADQGCFSAGDVSFLQKKRELIQINNWDVGAALKVKASLAHTEGVLHWDKLCPNFFNYVKVKLTSGFDWRSYFIVPDGNYFINPIASNHTVMYMKYGGFIHVKKSFLKGRVVVSGTLRMDKADYFTWRWNPRVSFVYSPHSNWNVRLSHQSGYRFPSIFEAFSNVNSGGVKRVGGLPIMSQGVFENAYTKVSIDAFQAKVIADMNAGGMPQRVAIEKNKELLKKSVYSYVKPEYIKSFEFGVRGLCFKKKLSIDADFYLNSYSNFIAQVEVSVPNIGVADSIASSLFLKSTQTRYRLWTNSQSKVYTYGSSLGLSVNVSEKIGWSGNVTFSRLKRVDSKDGLEDGYNTPQIMLNSTVSLKRIWSTLGASFGCRHQAGYAYVSALVSGVVLPYTVFDFQVNYSVEKLHLTSKLGATNLFNRVYSSMLGGPAIGGMYYVSLTYSLVH